MTTGPNISTSGTISGLSSCSGSSGSNDDSFTVSLTGAGANESLTITPPSGIEIKEEDLIVEIGMVMGTNRIHYPNWPNRSS